MCRSEGGQRQRSVKDPTKKLSVVWWPRTTTIYRSLHFIALPSTSRIRIHIYIRKRPITYRPPGAILPILYS
ncbi:hypothetical protein BDFB_012639 [Asbolus verrucosus]|uniref:Uncharacterized protein n=1 Tax=Asbolus verrucosus TaxID=1661398 RepID=A0A482VX95_ASBVE|nr:hypothetical protein BDFB_012639 [Asbolus verrucosus]